MTVPAGDQPPPCKVCGEDFDKPHLPVDDDCILPHRYDRKAHPPKARIGFVCRGCVERHRESLDEIVELYATLHQVVFAGSVTAAPAENQFGRKQAPKRPASPSPLRLEAWAMLYDTGRLNSAVTDPHDPYSGELVPAYLGANLPDVPAVLTAWAQYAYDEVGYTDTAPDTVSGAATVCKSHADTLATSSDVDTYDAELRWVLRHLRGAHGVTGPKPLCGCLSVGCSGTIWSGTVNKPTPHCRACKREYGTLDLVRAQINEGRAS